jgi:ABC-type branched-subunit amino acid transport system permease subunit
MRTVALGLGVALLAAVADLFVPPYLRFLLAQLSVVVIAVLSLNLLGNVAGMLSLASAAFMGLGGYGVLILLTMYGVPLVVSIPLTVIGGWMVGWLMGVIAMRLSGISLAIVTFGFIQIFQVFAKQGGAFSGDGYGLITPPLVAPVVGTVTPNMIAAACVFVAVIVAVLTMTLTRSRIGRAWYAIKEKPVAAQTQGVNLLLERANAFATSGAMASLAGALQAILLGITNPNLYTVDVSISHLAMMVVGGSSGDIAGPILGPVVLFLLPEYFDLGAYKEIFYGAALLVTLALAPRGLAGAWNFGVRRLVAIRH